MYLLGIAVFVPVKQVDAIHVFHPAIIEIDDAGLRPIVGIQMDHPAFALGKTGRELKNVPDGGTSETVHALVIIAHHADVLLITCQQEYQLFLNVVRILVFINHDIADALSELIKHLRMLHQHVISFCLYGGEIHGTVAFQKFLITLYEPCQKAHVLIGICLHGFHVNQLLHHLVDVPANLHGLFPDAPSGDVAGISAQPVKAL